MPCIIQSSIDSKGLSEEFNFRERRDSCGGKDEEAILFEILLARCQKSREDLELERLTFYIDESF